MGFRTEHDSMGSICVSDEFYWGAQTQRSLENFKIGHETMPENLIKALAQVKKAAAKANFECGVLSAEKQDLILEVCDEILAGKLNRHFPLVIWQTGSGTQTNMNLNEVIANRAEEILRRQIDSDKRFISPNDDVNKSQSTNDVFPTAMRIATVSYIVAHTLPALEALRKELALKSQKFHAIIKVGRTHLMDATPLRLGQEFSAFEAQLGYGIQALQHALIHLKELPLGGTAVGTGLNTPKDYAEKAVHYIGAWTGIDFKICPNRFEAMASHDAFVELSGALKQIAVSLMKMANDIRLLGSGPRAGLNELVLPSNEPGSSIMPGKVNPTQCEALTMVCCQIIGNDTAITVGGMQGHLQLNAFMPLIARNILHSVEILADAAKSFHENCVHGLQANTSQIADYLARSLMSVTALNPHIGYHQAAQIAQHAHRNQITLKQAALELELVSEEDFDHWVNPELMV